VAETTVSSITLKWEHVEGAIGYDILVDGKMIERGLERTYTHSDLLPNSVHVYRVRARGVDSVGAWSEAVTRSTMLSAPVIKEVKKTSSTIAIYWHEVPGASQYEVEADGQLAQVSDKTGFFHGSLAPNSKHMYRIRARSGDVMGEWSDWSSFYTATTPPSVPTGLKGVPSTTSATLTWSPSAGSVWYELEIDGEMVSDITGTRYVHDELKPNTMHEYRVRASNGGGTSEWSPYIRVRTTPEITIDIAKDTAFNFVVVAPRADGKERRIVVTYDPARLKVQDLSTISPDEETTAGPIPGANLVVSSFEPGRIEYIVQDPSRTTVNGIRFLTLTNEFSKVTYTVE